MAKILVVDDENDITDILMIVLKLQGHYVEVANSASQMLQKLHLFIPEIILLDVMLNGENGRDLCKQIKSLPYSIDIILMSANSDLLKDYEECKACDVIDKPFHMSDVLEKVNGLVKKMNRLGS